MSSIISDCDFSLVFDKGISGLDNQTVVSVQQLLDNSQNNTNNTTSPGNFANNFNYTLTHYFSHFLYTIYNHYIIYYDHFFFL